MDNPLWQTVREEFTFDGSWRDIYVLRTTIADWQRMLDAIRAARYTLVYFRNDERTELPGDASEVFPIPGECDRRLSVWVSDVQANCHFFTVEEIEFDIDPREVKGQQQLDDLFGFMRCLAESTGKEAVLTAENCPEIVIFRVHPAQVTVEHSSFGGWHDLGK